MTRGRVAQHRDIEFVGQHDRTARLDADDCFEVIRGDGLEETVDQTAGGVHGTVDGSELSFCCIECVAYPGGVGGIGHQNQEPWPRPPRAPRELGAVGTSDDSVRASPRTRRVRLVAEAAHSTRPRG